MKRWNTSHSITQQINAVLAIAQTKMGSKFAKQKSNARLTLLKISKYPASEPEWIPTTYMISCSALTSAITPSVNNKKPAFPAQISAIPSAQVLPTASSFQTARLSRWIKSKRWRSASQWESPIDFGLVTKMCAWDAKRWMKQHVR